MKKFWIGGATSDTGNYDNDENWQPFSLRNSTLAWTQSGSGTNEYYLRTSGGANPATGALSGLLEPQAVYADGTALTAGTAGSLTASQWDWADNDTLGYSTVYVRLSDGADPDSKATDFVTATDTPNANDDVFIGPKIVSGTATSYNIDEGLDQASVELDDFVVLPTYTGKIGLPTQPLKIDMGNTDTFRFEGRGTSYIDVGTAAIDPEIIQTAQASNGAAGLYLTGSAIDILNLQGGSVKLDGATVTTVQVRPGGILNVGYDSTVTTTNNSGTTTFSGTGVTINCESGAVIVNGTDALAVNVHGGVVYNDGLGTMTAVTYGGVLDAQRDGRSKSMTLTVNGGQVLIGSNVTLTGTFNASVRISAVQ